MTELIRIIVIVLIPFIVEKLKGLKLSKKLIPVMVIVLATCYMVIARIVGLEADTNTVLDKILTIFGISGVSVLGYDSFKLITATKPATTSKK
jgi:hypothetical protein